MDNLDSISFFSSSTQFWLLFFLKKMLLMGDQQKDPSTCSLKKMLLMGDQQKDPSTCSFSVFGIEAKLKGYSLSKGLGIGTFIESHIFAAAGYEWKIKFYPDGDKRLNIASHVSLYIVLASNQTNITANFELALVGQNEKKLHKVRKSRTSHLFKCRGSQWGFSRFCVRSLLDNSDYVKDDCLLIRCRIREDAKIHNVTVPPSDIGQHIGQLLETGEGSDIKFDVNGEIFAAHKCVLVTRSPVFRAQLMGPMKDDDTKEFVEITDMEATVFKALLHFIYWDTLPADLEYLFTQHMLEAADRYGLERLRLICEAKLCEGVDIDTAATTLALAEQHHCSQLKSVCFHFISQKHNFKVVTQTDGFRHLQNSCPSLVYELMQYVCEHSVVSSKQVKSKKLSLCWPF